jgi:Uma2 family endonuclease
MNPAVREPPAVKRYRWTVEKYFELVDAGILDGRRVELLNGEVIKVPAQADPHMLAIAKVSRLLHRTFSEETHSVFIQGTLILGKHDAPDPDLHVFDVPEGTPREMRPAVPILLIEVSDKTYRKDVGPKLRLYAASGVADYWIINIPSQRVEVYRSPENPTGRKSGWRYAQSTPFTRSQQVQLLACPDISFAVDALLP